MTPAASNRAESARLYEIRERRRELGQPFGCLDAAIAVLEALADRQEQRAAAARDAGQLGLDFSS